MNTHFSPIKKRVMAAITSGNTYMRPKWYFILRGILFSLGLILLAIALVYVASLIVFALKQTGLLTTPSMGLRGIGIFLLSAPWALVGTAVLFIITLEILVQKFSFAYKRPLLISITAIFIVAFVGTLIISRAHLHEFLHEQARKGTLPIMDSLYRGFDRGIPRIVFPGVVIDIDTTRIILERPDGVIDTILLDTHTNLPPQKLEIHDRVIILIREKEGLLFAEHIHSAPPDGFIPFRKWYTAEKHIDMPPALMK